MPRPAHRPLLSRLLAGVPAVFLTGPRATGKTTTALRLAHDVVRLDRPAEAAVFIADPDAALRGLAEPVLLDEWQVVPGVLGAIKRSVDLDPRPGRFLVTGSVHSSTDAGVVLHTGPRTYQLAERVFAAPIGTIWAGARQVPMG